MIVSDGFPLGHHQVVLKALDPVFEIEDPYAYNIQGKQTLLPSQRCCLANDATSQRCYEPTMLRAPFLQENRNYMSVVLRSDHGDQHPHQLHTSIHSGRHFAEEAQKPPGQVLLRPV